MRKSISRLKELKELDKQILRLLQDQNLCVPRITKIAHILKVPTSTVQSRINKLQDTGVIIGFTALVDPSKVGKSYVAFVFGQAKLGKDVNLETMII